MDKIEDWSIDEVGEWLERSGFREFVLIFSDEHKIDGKSLLLLNEDDLKVMGITRIGDVKRLMISIRQLQSISPHFSFIQTSTASSEHNNGSDFSGDDEREITFHDSSHSNISKTLLSIVYFLGATWVTAFTMVIVHERVPNMETYPPLPDIFLDNVPMIPCAFTLAEISGVLLFIIWFIIAFLHKHRFILLRRTCSLFGTVFLIRCITMFSTSLSVPGRHLSCHARDLNTFWQKLAAASLIWQGGGLSVQGIKSCGDYMFSGHTVALSLFNFFITEYTPRSMYLLHTFSWVLNIFGIFFIMAGHEHYSIDVFVAFYFSTRLFLYYHTLANNGANKTGSKSKTRIWFPLFYYFESDVNGIVPNEFETPLEIFRNFKHWLKDSFRSVAKMFFKFF